MNDESRRKWDAFVRIRQFGTDNAADFGAGSPATVQFNLLGTIIASVDTSAADQFDAGGDYSQLIEAKANAREDLRGRMSEIAMAARSMVYVIPGVDEKFRMPRNRNDADLLAAGRAFQTNSSTYEVTFISYGLAADFRDLLHDSADNFEALMPNVASALADRVEAVAQIDDWVTQGMRSRRVLDGIVRIKYANNPGKLAAWASASHIEKAPAKPKPPTP
jgi:hypothetical protein